MPLYGILGVRLRPHVPITALLWPSTPLTVPLNSKRPVGFMQEICHHVVSSSLFRHGIEVVALFCGLYEVNCRHKVEVLSVDCYNAVFCRSSVVIMPYL